MDARIKSGHDEGWDLLGLLGQSVNSGEGARQGRDHGMDARIKSGHDDEEGFFGRLFKPWLLQLLRR